jgi:hypothetical protein
MEVNCNLVLGRKVHYYYISDILHGPLPALVTKFYSPDKTDLRVVFVNEFATADLKEVPFCNPKENIKPDRFWFLENLEEESDFNRFENISNRIYSIPKALISKKEYANSSKLEAPNGGFIDLLDENGIRKMNVYVPKDSVIFVKYNLHEF